MSTIKVSFQEFKDNPSNDTRKKFIEDFSAAIQETLDENTKPSVVEENMALLSEISQNLPETFYTEDKSATLSFILNNTSPSVFKYWREKQLQIPKPQDLNLEIKTIDEITYTLFYNFLSYCTINDIEICLTKVTTEKKKQKAQAKFIVLELYHYVAINIEKKENKFKSLLANLLRSLNQSLKKYIKYQKNLESNKYLEVPRKISEFLENFEKWTKEFLTNLFDTLIQIVLKSSESKKLLLPEDLFTFSNNSIHLQKLKPSNEKAINHYCILFILDIYEGLLDAKTNNYFSKENLEGFILKINNDLTLINNPLWEYVDIYNKQTKIMKLDPEIADANKRDVNNLPIGDYNIYGIYNGGSIAALMGAVIRTPKELALLTGEFKLQLLLPCIVDLVNSTFEKGELKNDLISNAALLIKDLESKNKNPIDNLNLVGISMDKVLEKILDHCGGFVNETVKAQGITIFLTFMKLLTERAQARLLVYVIVNSRYHSLIGFIASEYQKRFSQAIKDLKISQEVTDQVFAYFDLNLFKMFFSASGDALSPNYKHNTDLTNTLISILVLVFAKYTELLKGVNLYKTLTFKDSASLFNPINRDHLMVIGEKIKLLQSDFEEKINLGKKQIEQSKQDPQSSNLVTNQNIKLNEYYIIQDSIARLVESYTEFKTL